MLPVIVLLRRALLSGAEVTVVERILVLLSLKIQMLVTVPVTSLMICLMMLRVVV